MTRLLAFVVLAGCAGSPSAPSGDASAPVLRETAPVFVPTAPPPLVEGIRIATFNGEFLFDGVGDEGEATFPWKGDPDAARAHRAAVGEVIRTLDADLVLIPETENLDALQMLLDETLAGMDYTPVLVDGLDTFTGQDVGMLTRLPVEAANRTNERVAVGVSDRMYGVSKNLWVQTSLPDGTPVSVIGVHFLARPDAVDRKERREAQAEVIRRLVEAEVAAGREVIVLGDINDFDDAVRDRRGSEPISDVMAIVKRAGPGPEDDLVNVIGDVPQAQRFTSFYDRDGDDEFDEGEFSAIDHVLLSPALYRRVVDVRYVHSFDPRAVSDHFPVVVTLR